MSGQQTTSTSGKTTRKAGVSAIPKGYHTVTPYLMVDDAAKFIDFMTRAFNAKAGEKMKTPDGKIGHAEVQIGDSHIMLSDSMSDHKALPAMLYFYLDDVDTFYRRAIDAGATSVKEPADQFYGDRAGCVKMADITIWIATHIEDVPRDELERRSREAMKQMAQQKH
jgi:PhnB protein